MRFLLSVFLIVGGLGLKKAEAADRADRERLIGTWEVIDQSQKPIRWTLTGVISKLRLTESSGGKEITDFECDTTGLPCSLRLDGHRAEISMWFNGNSLQVMQTKGQTALREEFVVVDDDVLEVRVTPLIPSGANQKLRLHRVVNTAATTSK